MRIPDATIDDIRNATDIVDVIGAFVRLRKRGKNFIGLCPFHQEKTPSFGISPSKQLYYCHGCGAGGDAIRFVMELEGKGFIEAVRKLAELYGVSLPARTGSGRRGVCSRTG